MNLEDLILNGVDGNEFTSDKKLRSLFRSKLGLQKNSSAIVLGAAGRLVEDKGHPILYEAFSKLTKTHSNVYLVVAESGPWEQRYKELGQKISVFGSLNPNELKGFYYGINLSVNPMLRPQWIDLTLMEAMLSSKTGDGIEGLTKVMEVAVAEGSSDKLAERAREEV